MAGKVHWLDAPAAHDFKAAQDYLSLLGPHDFVRVLVERLGNAGIEKRRANDLLRASDLELLPADDESVARDLARIKEGQPLSPVLAVVIGGKLQIADGYHRICACYHHDEGTPVRVFVA